MSDSQLSVNENRGSCKLRMERMNNIINSAFDMIAMMGTYEDRLVRNTKNDEFELDTVAVYDRPWNYETAVQHDDFYDGDWIILDGCDTKEAAEEMHQRWLDKLLSGVDELTDIFTCDVFHTMHGCNFLKHTLVNNESHSL